MHGYNNSIAKIRYKNGFDEWLVNNYGFSPIELWQIIQSSLMDNAFITDKVNDMVTRNQPLIYRQTHAIAAKVNATTSNITFSLAIEYTELVILFSTAIGQTKEAVR